MISQFRRTGIVIGGAALALNTACYAYEPAITSGVPAGEQVRVELNPQGTIELARYLGPRVAIVDGTINSVAGDTALLIVVESVQLVDGVRQPWNGEGVVRFPVTYVAALRRRVLDKRQTTIASVALTGALVAIAVIALRAAGASGGSDVGSGGPPP